MLMLLHDTSLPAFPPLVGQNRSLSSSFDSLSILVKIVAHDLLTSSLVIDVRQFSGPQSRSLEFVPVLIL